MKTSMSANKALKDNHVLTTNEIQTIVKHRDITNEPKKMRCKVKLKVQDDSKFMNMNSFKSV